MAEHEPPTEGDLELWEALCAANGDGPIRMESGLYFVEACQAEFFAVSHKAMPRLVAEVRRLRAWKSVRRATACQQRCGHCPGCERGEGTLEDLRAYLEANPDEPTKIDHGV